MGTALAPGQHDALARALPDEERFVLLARDPLAGHLVSIWSKLRMACDIEAAEAVFRHLCGIAQQHYWTTPDVDGASEALDVALSMYAWRRANEGRWRLPTPSPAAGGPTPPRDGHEAIHAKLDLLLEGQKTIMAQQDDLKAELAQLGADIDAEVQKLDDALSAKAADLGIDLSPEITAVRNLRAKLGDMTSVITPAPAGDTPPANDPAATPADGATAGS